MQLAPHVYIADTDLPNNALLHVDACRQLSNPGACLILELGLWYTFLTTL